MSDEHAAAMQEFSEDIANQVLTNPELDEPEWDTWAVLGDVGDNRVALTAYAYTDAGGVRPLEPPEESWGFVQLRDRTRGFDGSAWDVIVVKFHRDTMNLIM